jgi:hypothetical protein
VTGEGFVDYFVQTQTRLPHNYSRYVNVKWCGVTVELDGFVLIWTKSFRIHTTLIICYSYRFIGVFYFKTKNYWLKSFTATATLLQNVIFFLFNPRLVTNSWMWARAGTTCCTLFSSFSTRQPPIHFTSVWDP